MKKYEEPVIIISFFDTNDIICDSGDPEDEWDSVKPITEDM